MNTIKAIFFDYDGVMTIDKTGTQSVCNYISKNCLVDLKIFEKEYRKYNTDILYGKTTHEKIWNELCSNINKNIPISVLYDSFANTPIDAEMHSFARRIKESKIKTGLITDNKADRMKMLTEKYKLREIFDIILISAEIGSGKESRKIFEMAISEAGCSPSECIFIDNQEKNLVIPGKMGINVIYYDDEKRDIEKLKTDIAEISSTGYSFLLPKS